VLKGYPGVTVGLQRLEFSGKFEPLIHRWAELQDAISQLSDATEEDRTTKEHAGLLQKVLIDEFKSLIDTSQDMKSKRVMTYEHLWTLYQPGSFVYTRHDGQETAMTLVETKYGVTAKGAPCFWVMGKYVDWDGAKFGTQKMNLPIMLYDGTRPINQLRIFPIEFHHEAKALRARLIDRGARAEALAGPNYRAYHGVGWRYDSFGNKDTHNVKGRIVIDTYGWNRFNPSYAIFVSPFTQKEKERVQNHDESPDASGDPNDIDDYGDFDDNEDGGMPMDGLFAEEEDATRHVPLTTEQKLICTPMLRGYSLKTKDWLNFFVNCVKEIEWQNNAFDRLVLPQNQKELILGFAQSQRKYRETFDDVIEGKGRGMIVLLSGPPGVGKTLTAESVAEEMKVPLYMMSAGDLGLDPRRVEQKLQDILEMCTRWNSVLLLDEADVFLEQRSLHELERNKLVSIFLRVLEYYEGKLVIESLCSTVANVESCRHHVSHHQPRQHLRSRLPIAHSHLPRLSRTLY
jgi:hypothetical protein